MINSVYIISVNKWSQFVTPLLTWCWSAGFLKTSALKIPYFFLQAYINSLTQKTVKSQKSVNFEDLGDSISISSDIEEAKPQVNTAAGSKFLKKKPGQDGADTGQGRGTAGGSKFLKQPLASSVSPQTAGAAQPRSVCTRC